MALDFDTLYIRDFKSFRGEHVFDLKRAPGLYAIHGENKVEVDLGANGVGKSTLIDAIYWCLEGKTLRSSRPGGEIDPWDTEGKPRVELSMKRDGVSFVVARARKPIILEVEENDQWTTVEQDYVDKRIGLNAESLRRTLIYPQFGERFLDLKPEPQSQIFVDTLNLDVWLRAVERTQKRMDALSSEARALEREVDTLKGKKAQLEEQIADDEERAENFTEDLREKLDAVQIRIDRAKEKLKALVEPRQPDWKEAERLDAELSELLKAPSDRCSKCGQPLRDADFDKHIAEARVASERLRALNREREGEYRRYQDNRAELRESVRFLTEEWERLDASENPHAERARQSRVLHRKMEEVIADKEHDLCLTARRIAECQYWKDAFREIRLSLIDEALQELEVASNNHADDLGLRGWTIKFATERETASGSTKYGFTTLIYPPGYADPIPWTSYSGGESTRINLAVTFALSEVLLTRSGISPNIEFLDEPTAHLSENGIENLLACLTQRSRQLRRAVYFIDHRAYPVANFDGEIRIVKDEDGSVIED